MAQENPSSPEFVVVEHEECMRRMSEEMKCEIQKLETRVEQLERKVKGGVYAALAVDYFWNTFQGFCVLILPLLAGLLLDYAVPTYTFDLGAQGARHGIIAMFMTTSLVLGLPIFLTTLQDLVWFLDDCKMMLDFKPMDLVGEKAAVDEQGAGTNGESENAVDNDEKDDGDAVDNAGGDAGDEQPEEENSTAPQDHGEEEEEEPQY